MSYINISQQPLSWVKYPYKEIYPLRCTPAIPPVINTGDYSYNYIKQNITTWIDNAIYLLAEQSDEI